MKGFFILATLTLVYPRWNYASLILQGPQVPVEEGDYLSLECQSDLDSNMTDVHFEKFSKHMQKWFRLEPYAYGRYRFCSYYDMEVSREQGSLSLSFSHIQSYMEGSYRCVSNNAANPENSSLPVYIPVHYMREITVYKEGVNAVSRYFQRLDLRVRVGEDVELNCNVSASMDPQITWMKEGEDWLVLSSKLKLKNVRVEDSGSYTCVAQHPSISSLKRSRTVNVTVLPDAPWYDTTEGRLTLMISASGVGLLLLIMSVSICLCRRASGRKRKGPIDDRSQKKPVYMVSTESLPSNNGDKQPLV
ncbi:vascular endothelial growth factor receptor 3 isoform X2 [Conger conger]|uniref:vascular endothelial growth factor receptor 3 isoform X2 n=1 Tax=Conger conger TaxID=82655 RepID=UPI002A59FFF8|nr:vascular endothelial growth factor receptor 3 isoform X2 [Conger conger]